MKTKIVPFDLETAKKIQAGEVDGKVKTQCGDNVSALCIKDEVVAATILHDRDKSEYLFFYDQNGIPMSPADIIEKKIFQLVLEVPYKFRPFDRVLVRDEEREPWRATLFSNYNDNISYPYYTINGPYVQCIPYEGNEDLVGTKNTPKED